jgi:hypothetical protein
LPVFKRSLLFVGSRRPARELGRLFGFETSLFFRQLTDPQNAP